jgi:hypothetical protein
MIPVLKREFFGILRSPRALWALLITAVVFAIVVLARQFRRVGVREDVVPAHGFVAAVQDVAAHVPVLGQRVGARHHEQRAVHHDLHVERPGVGAVHDVAGEHLESDQPGERHDQPGEGLARERRDAVDGEEKLLHCESPGTSRRVRAGVLCVESWCAAGVTRTPRRARSTAVAAGRRPRRRRPMPTTISPSCRSSG